MPKVIIGVGILFLILLGLSADNNQNNKPNPVRNSEQTEVTRSQQSDTKQSRGDESSKETEPAASCDNLNVGYMTNVNINGRTVSIWYPTHTKATPHAYSADFNSTLATGAEPSQCEEYPLIVFSHGLAGCKNQTLFLTEELARAGYIVVAPDHNDALCGTSGAPIDLSTDSSFLEPETWSDNSERDRRDDVQAVISGILSNSTFKNSIDSGKIGVAGHSLGGYTALGLAGAWSSWEDDRIDAVLVMSPYAAPFLEKETLGNIDIPVMYQGAMFDIGITPSLKGPDGAYAKTPSPAYFVELVGGTHFEWTNLLCAGKQTTTQCLNGNANARLINRYGIAFFDMHLKGESSSVLHSSAGVATYEKK